MDSGAWQESGRRRRDSSQSWLLETSAKVSENESSMERKRPTVVDSRRSGKQLSASRGNVSSDFPAKLNNSAPEVLANNDSQKINDISNNSVNNEDPAPSRKEHENSKGSDNNEDQAAEGLSPHELELFRPPEDEFPELAAAVAGVSPSVKNSSGRYEFHYFRILSLHVLLRFTSLWSVDDL